MAENLMITVTDKATHTQFTVAGPQIALYGQSVVEFPVPQTQIKSLVRHGDALVVTTVDGQVIVLHGFFTQGGHSDLATLDGRHGESIIANIDWTSMDGQTDAAIMQTAHVAAPVSTEDSYLFFDQNATPENDHDRDRAAVICADPPAGDPSVISSDTVAAVTTDATSGTDAAAAGANAVDVGTSNSASTLAGASGAANSDGDSRGAFVWLPLAVAGLGIGATLSGARSGGTRVPTDMVPEPTIGNISQNADGTLTVTGKATPGDRVTVTMPDGSTATATVASDGSYSATSTDVQTSGTVMAVDTNPAGNSSTGVVQEWVDTTPPVVSSVNVVGNSDGGVTVSGTSEPGSTVKVIFPDHVTSGTVVAGSDGSYSITTHVPQTNGTVEVSASDAAGNSSTPIEVNYTDTTPPNAPSIGTVTDNPDGTVTITGGPGSAEGDSTITVKWPDGSTSTVTAGSDGSYQITSPTPQPDGTIDVTATDKAGNESPPTSQNYTQTDHGLNITGITDDTGASQSDFITDDNTLIVAGAFTQAVPAQAVVQISFDGGKSWQPVNINGNNWTYDNTGTTLSDGTYNVIVRETSSSGTILGTYVKAVLVDTVAPTETTTIGSVAAATISGTLSAALNTAGGSLEYVQVSTDGGQTWSSATVSGTTWTYTPTTPLYNGVYTVEARVIDVAGNAGQATIQQSTVTDGLTPPTPTQTASLVAISPDNGPSSTDFVTSTGSLTLSGTVQGTLTSTEQVQVSIDGGTWQNATVGANGWTLALATPLGEGSHTAQTRVYDTSTSLAGSVTDGPQPIVVDLTSPTETVAIATTATSGVGSVTFSGTLSAPLSATGSSYEILQISTDGGANWQNVPSSSVSGTNWTWTYNTSPLANSYPLEARVIDLAGNTGPLASQVVTLGSTSNGQDTPTQTASLTVISPDSGPSTTDFITNTGSLTLSGTVQGALTGTERVQVSIDGGTWQNATVGANGWSLALTTPLAEGSHSVQTRVYDSNNTLVGPVTTSPQPILVDTTKPTETVTIATTSTDGKSFSGTLSSALNANGGSTESLQISLDGGKTWQTATVTGTSWNYTSTGTALATGSTVEAQVIDLAGNTGTLATQAVTVTGGGSNGGNGDGTGNGTGNAPTQTAALTAINPDTGASNTDFVTNTGALTLSGTITGTLTSTEQVQVSIDGGPPQTATVGANGWSLVLTTPLAEGSHTVTTQVYDTSSKLAGPPTTTSTQPIVVDTTAPPETVTISPTTSTDGLTVSGTLSAALNQTPGLAETLQIRIDGGAWQTVPSNEIEGTTWSYIGSTPLNSGSHTVEAQVIDLAGNTNTIVKQTFGGTGGDGNGTTPTQTASLTAISPDSGPSTTDFITNTGALTLSGAVQGTLTSTEQVRVVIDGGTPQTATVNGSGWTLATQLAEGSHTVQTQVYDTSSSQAGTSTNGPQPILVDTTKPTETVTIATTSTDGKTFTGSLSGALNANGGSTESLQISTDGGTTWQTATVTGTSWNYTSTGTALATGSTVEAQVIDLAGNTGTLATQAVTVTGGGGDGTGTTPTQTATLTAISPDEGISATDFITDVNGITLSGTLSAVLTTGQELQINLNGTWETVPEDNIKGTTWSYDATDLNLKDGNYTVQLRVAADSTTNAATGTVTTSTKPVIIDTAAPSEVITISPNTSADGQTVSGTLDQALNTKGGSNEYLELSFDDGAHWVAVPAADVNGTTWSYPSGASLGAAGSSVSVQARVVDEAGNAGSPVTKSVVVGGAGAPETATLTSISPDDGASSTDFITDTGALTLSGTITGTLTSTEQVRVVIDGGTPQIATVNAAGTGWTLALPSASPLAQGSHTVTTQVYDPGSSSVVSTTPSQPIVVDTTKPTETVTIATTSPDGKTFTGTLSSALDTSGSAATGGSAESLQISLDGGKTWDTVTVNGTNWTYTSNTALPTGTTVEAQVVDLAGNKGTLATQAVTVTGGGGDGTGGDGTGGLTVTIAKVNPDSGSSSSDFIVNARTGLTFTGTLSTALASGQTLQISLDGGTNWTPIPASGITGTAWTYTYSGANLSQGSQVVEVKVTDGSETGAVASQTLFVDSVSPPELINGLTVSSNGLTISGTLSAPLNGTTGSGGSAETLVVSIAGRQQTVPAANIHSDNTWSLTLNTAVTNATIVTAFVQDAAGNSGQIARLTVSGVTPGDSTPSPTDSGDVQDLAVSSDGLTISGTLATALTGTGSSAETLVVAVNGEEQTVSAANIHSDGTWSLTLDTPVTNGETVTAAIQDADGNNTGESATLTVSGVTAGNTTPPPPPPGDSSLPTVTIASVSPDSGSNTDFITKTDTGLTFTGALNTALASGQTLQISLDGGSTWTTIPAANITSTGWTYTYSGTALTQGSHLVEVEVISGSQTGTVASQALVIDSTVPTEQISNLAVSTDGLTVSGTLSGALNTSGGTIETLAVIVNGVAQAVPAANIKTDGTWSLTLSTPVASGSVVSAEVFDQAANIGPVASILVGGINIASLTMAVGGVNSPDFVSTAPTSNQPVTFNGTLSQPLPAGDQVLVNLDGSSNWQIATTTAGSTSWSLTPSAWPLVPTGATSSYQVVAVVVNASNQAVGQQTTQAVTFDNRSFDTNTAALTLVTPDPAWGGTWDSAVTTWVNAAGSSTAKPSFATTQNTGLTFSGTASAASGTGNLGYSVMPGDTVQISLDGGTGTGTNWQTATTLGTTANSSGIYWSYTDSDKLADGSYTVQVRYVSAAGITGKAVSAGTVVVDSHVPSETTSITAVAGGTAAGSGFTTNNGVLALTGTVSAKLGTGDTNATESVQASFDGGTTWRTATTDATGLTWSITAPDVLAPGNYDVETRVVNSAGGVGQSTSQQITVTEGTTTPVTLAPVSVNTDPAYHIPVASGNKLTYTANTAALPSGDTVQFAIVEGSSVASGTTVSWYPGTSNAAGTQWTFDQTSTGLTDGMYTVLSRVVDSTGAAVGAAAQETFFVDTTAPTETLSVLSVSGAAPGSFVTNAGTGLVFQGTINSASATTAVNLVSSNASTEQVQVSLDGGTTWQPATSQMVSGTATVQWVYDYTGTALSDGAHTLQVRMADAAGNAGKVTSQVFVVDSQTNYAETLAITAISPDKGLSSTDFITQASVLTFSGTVSQPLASGQTVEISLDNGATWQNATTSGTNWSYADPNTLTDGTYYALARVVDASGAAQSATAMQTVTVDTTVPTEIATITGVGTGSTTLNPTTDGSPMGWSSTNVVDVVAELGTGTYLGQNGGSPESIAFSVDGGTTWHQASSTIGYGTAAQYIANLSNGIYAAETAVVDAAGNVGKISAAQVFGVYSGGAMTLNVTQIAQVANATGKQVEITSSSGATAITLAEGVGSGATQWTDTGPTTIGGTTFDVYHNAQAGSNTAADLLVQQGIKVG